MTLTTAEIIQILAVAVSLIIGVVAIWQSKKSIKLTETSIRDANRPYVTIYVETLDTIYFEKLLVVKNFGKTAARIIELTFHSKLDKINEGKNLDSLVNGWIMPNQKFMTTLDSEFKDLIVITIKYEDLDGHVYKNDIDIKTDMSSDLTWSVKRKTQDSPEVTAVKLASQAIVKAIK